MQNIITLITQYKYYLLAILFLLLLTVSIYIFLTRKEQGISLPQVQGVSQSDQEAVVSCSLFVDVSGAVKSPNVYCLNEGSLWIDAIKISGGYIGDRYAKEYVRSSINLAKPILNNEKIYIPFKDEVKLISMEYVLIEKDSGGNVVGGDSSSQCVSLNSASLNQLDSLNGIGPSIAQKIIDGRPYKVVEDLKEVSGIGDALFEKIVDSICI